VTLVVKVSRCFYREYGLQNWIELGEIYKFSVMAPLPGSIR